MLIKFDADDLFVEMLKLKTNQNTASKAFQAAASSFVHLTDTVEILRDELRLSRDQIRTQQQVIDGARDAAKLLIERVGQTDIFTN